MKTISTSTLVTELPFIRIEVTKFLAILERVSGDKYKITGRNSEVIFESIEDIKSHLAEFVRAPVIKIGPVEIDTRGNYNSPRLSSELNELNRIDADYTTDDAQILMKSLEQELIPFKRRLANPSVRLLPARLFLFIGVIWVPIVAALSLDADNNFMVYVFLLLSVIWLGLEKFVFRHVFGGNTVYYQPRETWYQRHSRELFSGAFSAVFGAVAGAVATFFLAK